MSHVVRGRLIESMDRLPNRYPWRTFIFCRHPSASMAIRTIIHISAPSRSPLPLLMSARLPASFDAWEP